MAQILLWEGYSFKDVNQRFMKQTKEYRKENGLCLCTPMSVSGDIHYDIREYQRKKLDSPKQLSEISLEYIIC